MSCADERDPEVGVGFLCGGARPPLPVVIDYIDKNRKEFGVEPICAVLKDADVPIAPSTYYASRTRPPSQRSITDADTACTIERVHRENYGGYGIRKVWAQLGREGGVDGRPIARCTVATLMKAAGLRGVSRVKTPRTTVRAAGPDLRPDLVERAFAAPAPNRLWVADITYSPSPSTSTGTTTAAYMASWG